MPGKDSQLQIRVSAGEKAAIRRAAERAGLEVSAWVLGRLLPPASRRFQQLAAQLAAEPDHQRYTLAALNELLNGLDAPSWEDAVADAPAVPLDPWAANYLAAMVETVAHRLGVAPPSWTGAVPPLAEPWFAVSLHALRLYLLLASPPAFKRRNLYVDSGVGARA